MASIDVLEITDFSPRVLVTLIFPPEWDIVDVVLLVAFQAVFEIDLCELP